MKFCNVINIAHCSDFNVDKFPERLKTALANETGRDRLKRMFSTNEFGISPELLYVFQSGCVMAGMAGIFGAFKGMIKAKDDFSRRNMASVYESQHLARRSLTDKMSIAAIQEGFKNAFKYGSFTTLYLLGTMTIANYRNKISVWEHVTCGAVLGGLSRSNYGVKGMLVAGGLGGFLGLLAGSVITLSMRLTGTNLEELRCWQHEEQYYRVLKQRKKEAEKRKKEEENAKKEKE